MDQYLAESLSRQLKIAVEHVVREEYELLILRELLASPPGNALVFKGAAALRLAYDSLRFSGDLDFSLLASVDEGAFVAAAAAAARAAAQITLVEALAKQLTLFALYRVTESFLPYAFSVKVVRPLVHRAEAPPWCMPYFTSTPLSASSLSSSWQRCWAWATASP